MDLSRKPSISQSEVSSDSRMPKSSVDVFTTPRTHHDAHIASESPDTGHFIGFFYQSSPPEIPMGPPKQYLHQFIFPSAPRHKTTIEDVFDDDESVLACRFGTQAQRQDLGDDDASSDLSDDHESDIGHEILPPGASPHTITFRDASNPFLDASIYLNDASKKDKRPGQLREAPSVLRANAALQELKKKLRPPRDKGPGYKDPNLDPFTRARMEGMQTFLALYVDPRSATHSHWGASSLQAALSLLRGRYCARMLRRLGRAFIDDRTVLPVNPYGDWNETMLVDEDLAQDVVLYLQELGKDIT